MNITSISPQKRKPNRSSVFIDGRFAFGIRNEDLAFLSISEGKEISQSQLDAIMNEKIYADAKNTALKYLSARQRTYNETVGRLSEYGFPDEIITRVMELLIKYNYINDGNYACDYAASRLKAGNCGPLKIKQELRTKGVDIDTIEESLKKAAENVDEKETVLNWLSRKRHDIRNMDAAEKKRASEALARRGFTWAAIREAFNGE